MDPFQMALDAMFQAPGSADAIYAKAGGVGAPVRVIIGQPDATTGFGDGRTVLPTTVVEVRRSEVPLPARGDTFAINGGIYRISNEPMLDVEALSWRCGVEPV